ncbi:aldo/keto reductase [Mangrovibacterium lignilyticum]|uniref:aldo/keto reductase n=1 Tax=Mangrovibacterium lignilyticum TaxID=2668052 RepID=UPI0013D2ADF4|nr:aldo/keto reductase [Mangrovibacterium lignilyticum]
MDFKNVSLYQPKMEYRRFGKTEKNVSVITLGGMRFKHGWTEPRHEIPQDTLDECRDTVEKALVQGINLIETAYGYGKSETVYGIVLNDVLKVPRDSYYLMTKGASTTAADTRKLVMEQLETLKTDYFDFYAWHGMNTLELYETACAPGGPVEELLKMKEEGLIKHVGFSTHAPLDVILKAIETDLFEFVNLHYYYFFQRNKAAVDLAASKDMGVFIISPNDKGGKLSTPPQKLIDLTAPLHPVQWNARFCLSHESIHTLTFGLPATCSFDLLNGIFPAPAPFAPEDKKIKERMDAQRELDPYAEYEGYDMLHDPSGLNIPEILRFRMMLKCYDMREFGLYRYNMFQEKDHWFPGNFPTAENLQKIDTSRCPQDVPVVELIEETHRELYKPKEKK